MQHGRNYREALRIWLRFTRESLSGKMKLKKLTRKVAGELWADMADNGCEAGEFYREAPDGMAKRVVSEAALAYQGPKKEGD